jgi:hypothetical protein
MTGRWRIEEDFCIQSICRPALRYTGKLGRPPRCQKGHSLALSNQRHKRGIEHNIICPSNSEGGSDGNGRRNSREKARTGKHSGKRSARYWWAIWIYTTCHSPLQYQSRRKSGQTRCKDWVGGTFSSSLRVSYMTLIITAETSPWLEA